MKSPIRLPGAKATENTWLPSLLPSAATWVEPFIGAGHVLLGAIGQGRWQNYLIGELDPVAANFWEQVAAGHSQAIAAVAQHYFPEWEVTELGWKGFGLTKGDHEIFINKVGRWTAWYSIDGYEDAKDFDSFEVLIDWLRDEI